MNSSHNNLNSFYSFLEKAWQPMWLANFIYCYLCVDIIAFYLTGNGIFSYSLSHVLDLSFSNIIITITVFGIFSTLVLPAIHILLHACMVVVEHKLSISSKKDDRYISDEGYVSHSQLKNKKVIEKFENEPSYLANIYAIENEKFNLELADLFKLRRLILGIIIFCVIEIFLIDCNDSNTICFYIQNFFDEKAIGYSVWIIYIPILLSLFSCYHYFCNKYPSFYFYNPVLYEQIKDVEK